MKLYLYNVELVKQAQESLQFFSDWSMPVINTCLLGIAIAGLLNIFNRGAFKTYVLIALSLLVLNYRIDVEFFCGTDSIMLSKVPWLSVLYLEFSTLFSGSSLTAHLADALSVTVLCVTGQVVFQSWRSACLTMAGFPAATVHPESLTKPDEPIVASLHSKYFTNKNLEDNHA